MSPEQVQGKPVDGRADQFSLAVVAYEILTGERPFSGEHLGTVVYKIVAEEPAIVHRLNPSLSPEIDTVVRKALSKKADGRYGSCIDFVNALEGACLQADGWQSLARGTSHNIPTEAEKLVKTRAPKTERTVRKKSSRSAAGQQQRKTSVFLPALGAFVVVLGVLCLLAWQSGLWKPGEPERTPERTIEAVKQEPPPVEKAKTEAKVDDVETPPAPPPDLPKPIETHPAQAEETKPEETKQVPSIVRKPAKSLPDAKPAVRIPVAEVAPRLGNAQDVFVQSNPSGVTAVLDNRADTACETPCLILASPGLHIVSLTLANYQKEIRQIKVGDSRYDLPLITMHPDGGTLMISTVPQGANIFVDDRLMGSMTPAQILLPGGSYNIKVELNGMRKTERVTIGNGNTTYRKIVLTP